MVIVGARKIPPGGIELRMEQVTYWLQKVCVVIRKINDHRQHTNAGNEPVPVIAGGAGKLSL